MAYVLSSVSGNLISAASAGFAPTNSAEVSAIASAYQVVTAIGTGWNSDDDEIVSAVNGCVLSADEARYAGAANWSNYAHYDRQPSRPGYRTISSLPGSAEVSAIASSYAESAASSKLDTTAQVVTSIDETYPATGGTFISRINGTNILAATADSAGDWIGASSKQDTLSFGYDADDKISAINGSALAGGGGGEADWSAESGQPGYIENKPVPKTLVAGANISISEGVGTLTISAAAGLPASTSADEGKCLVVDSNGDPEWGTGGKTYTGTDGVVVDNVNDTVGLEAPVDLVGGPGITVDNPDGNTVRVSLASTPYNETVLWEADLTVAVQDRAAGTTFTLSETPANFEILKVYCAKKWPVTEANDCGAFCNEVSTAMLSKQNGGVMMLQGFMAANDVVYQLYTKLTGCLTTTITEASGLQTSNGQGALSSSLIYLHPYRIVGINRISGGN